MVPKPPSVNTCQETRWKAISGLLASLLMNDVRFSLSRRHRHLSALGPQLQHVPESPLSSLSRYFARRHCRHQRRRWWEKVGHPPVLMAHLFNLLRPHIRSLLFINHTRQGCGAINTSGKQRRKAAEHPLIKPGRLPCSVRELHPAASRRADHPKRPSAEQNFWVQF